MGDGASDTKEIVILGRVVRWKEWGIEYEADPKHRAMIMDHFGFEEGSRALSCNGDKKEVEEDWELEELGKPEATIFRGMAARMNFLSQDCPDLQYAIKPGSRDMATPKRGSWTGMKKVARYLAGRRAVVWEYPWQEEPARSTVLVDSDWGGSSRDRRSTSGGDGC